MNDEGCSGEGQEPVDKSFVISLWLETERRLRGRIRDGEGCNLLFEDEQSLLGIIRSRLRDKFKVVLPTKRSGP
jgi:hypothetical protein